MRVFTSRLPRRTDRTRSFRSNTAPATVLLATGWVCQSDGRNTYVKVLSTDQAKSKFKVSSGNLPSKAVGTFTAAERKASAANSDTTYIRENSSGATVSKVQTELKALGYYSGKVTGNAGPKTVAAIKSFSGQERPDGGRHCRPADHRED